MKTIIKNILALSTFSIMLFSCAKDDDASIPTDDGSFKGNTVSDFAGNGTASDFDSPNDICVDSQGNFFVTDGSNHRIQKISPNGVISTFVGTGTAGYVNSGSIVPPRFNFPFGICIDAQDNLYVADSGNYAIRKITPQGVVSTIAGDGTSGTNDGMGTAARFTGPFGIAIDKNGVLYVTDIGSDKIRKISSTGVVSLFADGLQAPCLLKIDNDNTIYAFGIFSLKKITPQGVVTVITGSNSSVPFEDGPVSTAKFSGFYGGCLDNANNIYVVNTFNNCIRKISNGQVTTFAGTKVAGAINGPLLQAQFGNPYSAIIYKNKMYVVDKDNKKIRVTQ
jgi:NHL repeat